MPWAQLYALIEPFYLKPRADGGGPPAFGLGRMLRILIRSGYWRNAKKR
ncbi:MAG TPA: hypothetical protein VMA74_09885 [Dyella sp.]|nr:hypothetical protein [Dyella sp.]HUB90022.1 hypothetical protein [Dyella sp.]